MSKRIYQNERVLMKEVGLIKDYKLVITSEIVEDFEGTEKEVNELGKAFINMEDVVSVGVYQHR